MIFGRRRIAASFGLRGAGCRFEGGAVVWSRWLAGSLGWVTAVLANTVQTVTASTTLAPQQDGSLRWLTT